jgi:hypothetical protein
MLFYMGYLFCSPNFVISQTGDHPQEDIAKFGYRQDMKVNKI